MKNLWITLVSASQPLKCVKNQHFQHPLYFSSLATQVYLVAKVILDEETLIKTT